MLCDKSVTQISNEFLKISIIFLKTWYLFVNDIIGLRKKKNYKD